jgi:hypothetical protein
MSPGGISRRALPPASKTTTGVQHARRACKSPDIATRLGEESDVAADRE